MNTEPNCNRCANIRPHEYDQQAHEPHICTVYNTRCLHRVVRTRQFNHSFIHPCAECEKDGYKQYKED